jgi:hypothetical protein
MRGFGRCRIARAGFQIDSKRRSDAGTRLTYPPLFDFLLLGDAARRVARFRSRGAPVCALETKRERLPLAGMFRRSVLFGRMIMGLVAFAANRLALDHFMEDACAPPWKCLL